MRHEAVNETDKDPAEEAEILRTLVLRVEETRIRVTRLKKSQENQGWRIRVGRKLSAFPFIKLGVLSAHKNQRGISIRTNIGVKITWNGINDLRITLPSKFKSKMCGLCGNFNGKPEDDRLTRRGRYVSTPEKFVNSWKVGKIGYCAAVQAFKEKITNEGSALTVIRSYTKTDACSSNWEKKMNAMTACNILKEISVFGKCHRHVSIIPVYK